MKYVIPNKWRIVNVAWVEGENKALVTVFQDTDKQTTKELTFPIPASSVIHFPVGILLNLEISSLYHRDEGTKIEEYHPENERDPEEEGV